MERARAVFRNVVEAAWAVAVAALIVAAALGLILLARMVDAQL